MTHGCEAIRTMIQKRKTSRDRQTIQVECIQCLCFDDLVWIWDTLAAGIQSRCCVRERKSEWKENWTRRRLSANWANKKEKRERVSSCSILRTDRKRQAKSTEKREAQREGEQRIESCACWRQTEEEEQGDKCKGKGWGGWGWVDIAHVEGRRRRRGKSWQCRHLVFRTRATLVLVFVI